MSLKEDKEILRLQEQYEKIGSELQLCVFDVANNNESEYDISFKAAVKAMYVFKERYEDDWKRRNPDLDISQYFYIVIFEDKIPTGQKITLAKFFGEGYNFETDQIELYNYSEGGKSSKSETKGLTKALLSPPYGLRLMASGKRYSLEYGMEEQSKMTILFREFLKKVLVIEDVRETRHLTIYKWSDDWSNFFDAGKEWWGTYYWTILDKKRNKITIIAASATD